MADRITEEPLTAEHTQYLTAQAIDVGLATSLGVRSLVERSDAADLPDPWNSFANLPAILFPWAAADGRVEYQVRPDNPTTDQRGRPRKYMFRKDMTPVLWAVRVPPNAQQMLIVEGTKQCLAAASHAPEGVAVYGIAGCRSWQKDGTPIPDLGVADGMDVVVILDADATGNADVYAAGIGLAEALAMEGAEKIRFGRLPASGKAGLDDVLAGRPAGKRADYLARIISGAKAKPADKAPRAKRKGTDAPANTNRTTIVCNRDRLDVINDLTTALIDQWDGRELFNHGGVISRFRDGRMAPVDRGSSRDLIQETAITVDEIDDNSGIRYNFVWPDSNSIAAVMSRAGKFSPLERVSHAPFVRPDGSIVTTPGYDEATRTILIPDPELEGLTVPEHPTPAQVEAARDLIMTEWLGDFPFEGDADRANVLGLVVTPAIRGLVSVAPMAVIDGIQMGVGKNKIADTLMMVYTGHAALPMNFVDEKDELRKQITSAFRTGQEFFVFDEAHTIDGSPLAQALTASTWQDRILGVSTMAEFPNRVTWVALGNNVQVRGDITRRVYRVRVAPTYANPQDRADHLFRHPGVSGLRLEEWVKANRAELMTAILTLVRAWFSAGCPRPVSKMSMGSFEAWQKIVGGIVETAGLPGFLGNLTVWRSESDFDSQYWTNHLRWLTEQFGIMPFRTADVKQKALADPAGFMAPPKLDDPADKGYGKALGEAYSRLRGRRYDGLHIERAGNVSGHVSTWTVIEEDGPPTDPPAAPPLPEPDPAPVAEPVDSEVSEETHPAPCGYPDVMPCICGSGEDIELDLAEECQKNGPHDEGLHVEDCPDAELPVDLLTLDLECGDAKDLHRTGPGYVRLTGWTTEDGPVKIQEHAAGVRDVAAALRHAKEITGHNIMAFDLPALVREGVLTMPEVHELAREGRVFDGLLAARHLDPPMAKDKGVDLKRKYDLDSLGVKYGLGEKSTAAKILAKKHGGWASIPIDTQSEDGQAFRAYLEQDVNLSRALHGRLMDELCGVDMGLPRQVPEYLKREHQVAAIAAQISYNGFRVDVPELEKRVAEVNARKEQSLQLLHDKYGIPLTDARGRPQKSPLGTNAGKLALEKALREAGATSIWKTPSADMIDVSGDHMKHLAAEYAHLPAVREIAKEVYRIVGARSVYQTAHDCLIGDRVHPKIGFEQATGRWSVTSPGLTVFGKRGGRHVERMIFLPEPGEVILTVDLSQVDMRAIAGLSGDAAYIEMLRQEDPHAEIAKALFGDVKRREDAKAIGHGWNYGRGIKAISEGNDIDPLLVRQFDRSMHERFGRLVQWRDEVRELAASGALLDNGFGRPMRPDPQRAHTQGPALMGQGAARDVMTTGMLNSPPEVLPMLRAQIHDEIVLSVPEGDVPEVARVVVDALTFEWRGVPILADAGPVGRTWGHCYEKP